MGGNVVEGRPLNPSVARRFSRIVRRNASPLESSGNFRYGLLGRAQVPLSTDTTAKVWKTLQTRNQPIANQGLDMSSRGGMVVTSAPG